MTMSWKPHDPLVLLARPIENLQQLSEQAGIPHSGMKLLQKDCSITRNTRDFEHALTMWEDLLKTHKIWANFKAYFHEAQLNLKKIRGPTMHQTGYHNTNVLAMQMRRNKIICKLDDSTC